MRATVLDRWRASELTRVMGSSAGAKIAVMVLSGGLAIITTRLIITNYGVDAYAQYTLLASMAALVPFADLGMSAALINTVSASREPRADDLVRRTVLSALRILLASAGVLTALGLLLTVLGAWPTILGDALLPGGGTVALLCVVVFAATLPLGVGQRILVGLGRNHVQISTQALAAPFILGSVLLLLAVGAQVGGYVAVLSYAASAVVAGTSFGLAARALGPQVGRAIRDVPRLRGARGAPVFAVAGPMLVQMLALPVALQTDRLLLSHLAKLELPRYSLAAQLFGFVLNTIGAAGIALWPVFARARASGDVRSPVPLATGFLFGGLGVAGILALTLPWVVPLIADDEITLDLPVILAFVLFVGAQAAKYPLGMYMTDARGLRFQVAPILIMVPANVALSWLLIAPLGAAGPVLGSAITVFVFQVAPSWWYVQRDLRLRRAALSTPVPEVGD